MSSVLEQLKAKGFTKASTTKEETKPVKEEPKKEETKPVKEETKEVVEVEVFEEKPKPKAKSTKKTSKKKQEPEPEPEMEYMGSTEIAPIIPVNLPSVEDLISSGRPAIYGRKDILREVLSSFVPITYLRLAQAMRLPQQAGKIVHGSDDAPVVFTDVILPLYFHAWQRTTDYLKNELDTPQNMLTLYAYCPDQDKVVCISGKNFDLEALRNIASNDLSFIRLKSKAVKSEKQKSTFFALDYEKAIITDYELDREKLQKALNIVKVKLEQFYNDFPDQHPDATATDEIPF